MAEPCCSSPVPQSLDQTQAVEARYGAAALEQEACLCTPVGFDPALLKVIPDAVVERDYGCLLYTSPSPRDGHQSRMPSSA